MKGKKVMYRFTNTVDDFTIPIKVLIDDKPVWLEPTTNWQTQKLPGNLKTLQVDPNFYVETKH